MRENELEHRVQRKMEELKLVPSAEVWESVERRIRKEKKRRFLVWWPLALLLAGVAVTGGILLWGHKKETVPAIVQNNTIHEIKPEPKTSEGGPATRTTPVPATKTTQETPVTELPEPTNTKTNADVPVAKPGKNKPGKVSEGVPVRPVNADTKIVVATKKNEGEKPVVAIESKPPVTDNKTSETPAVLRENDQKQLPPAIQNEPEKIKPAGEKEKTVNVPATELPVVAKTEEDGQNKPGTIVPPVPDSTSTVAGKKATSVRKRNFKWGLHISYGGSNITEGPVFFKNNRMADATVLQAGPPVQFYSYGRTIYGSGKAWSAGSWFRTLLGPRLYAEGQLGYMYLSNKIAVGNRVDSTRLVNNTYSQGVSVNNFYRPPTGQTYTNSYHLLRLSATLSWQFLRSKKFRPEWENGLEYNRLMGSTMLHWDWNLPGYYRDNKLLVKNHLFYYTGLSVPVVKRVFLSPFASFSLTRVLHHNDSLRTNFSQWGIRLKIALGKK